MAATQLFAPLNATRRKAVAVARASGKARITTAMLRLLGAWTWLYVHAYHTAIADALDPLIGDITMGT